MEAVIKDCALQIKVAIEFLDKILVPSRQRPEKDEVITKLKRTLHACQQCTNGATPKTPNRPSAALPASPQDENIYDDSEPVAEAEAVYDDNFEGPGDDIYEDNVLAAEDVYEDNVIGGGDSQIYEDNVIGNGEDIYEDNVLGDPAAPTHGEQAACEDLKNVKLSSLLEYKRGNTILKSSWCRRWCVISDDFFYMYDSAKDKKPKDCFSLKAYAVDVNDGVSKETKRKGRCFVLRSNLSSKAYELCASDVASLASWKQQIEAINGSASAPAAVQDEDTYNDVIVDPVDRTLHEGNLQIRKKDLLFQSWMKRWCVLKQLQIDIYEVSKDGNKKYKSKFSIENCSVVDGKKNCFIVQDKTDAKRNLELCAPSEDDYKSWTGRLKKIFGADLIPEDIYDDTTEPGGDSAMIYDDTGLDQDQIYDDAGGVEASEDIYDDVTEASDITPPPIATKRLPSTPSTPTAPPPPPIPQQSRPSIPTTPKALRSLPPTIGRENRRESAIPQVVAENEPGEFSDDDSEIDYSSFYQGMWDCPADEDNELSFKRGDLIEIISKEHDCFGWWLGKMEDLSGFVPKVFLMTAYEL